jgi:hypothetical protein
MDPPRLTPEAHTEMLSEITRAKDLINELNHRGDLTPNGQGLTLRLRSVKKAETLEFLQSIIESVATFRYYLPENRDVIECWSILEPLARFIGVGPNIVSGDETGEVMMMTARTGMSIRRDAPL